MLRFLPRSPYLSFGEQRVLLASWFTSLAGSHFNNNNLMFMLLGVLVALFKLAVSRARWIRDLHMAVSNAILVFIIGAVLDFVTATLLGEFATCVSSLLSHVNTVAAFHWDTIVHQGCAIYQS